MTPSPTRSLPARLLAATALGALMTLSTATAEEIKIAMNGVNDPKANAEAAFVEGFETALEGTEFTVAVFPSGTMGKEEELFDQVTQNLIQVHLAAVSTGFSMSPLMKGVLLPFMFEDADEFDALIETSDLLEQMNEGLTPNGVRLAGFNYIGVGMGIHNTKHPVTKMADLADLRFRALNAEQLAYQEALGTSGTIVAWSEVANALQTGIADGYFNPPNSAIRTGHTEFLKHFTQANFSPSTRAILISEDWYEALSDDDRATVDAALDAGIAANRAWVDAWESDVMQKLANAGVTVSELAPGERDKMVEATRVTYADIMSADDLAKFEAALETVRQ